MAVRVQRHGVAAGHPRRVRTLSTAPLPQPPSQPTICSALVLPLCIASARLRRLRSWGQRCKCTATSQDGARVDRTSLGAAKSVRVPESEWESGGPSANDGTDAEGMAASDAEDAEDDDWADELVESFSESQGSFSDALSSFSEGLGGSLSSMDIDVADSLSALDPAPPLPQVLEHPGPHGVEAFEAILEEVRAGVPLTSDRIVTVMPYPLDAFQREALETFLEGSSVVVCAPTGAGKTAIAVACAVPILARGQKVIYTTPLKALSNQKFRELQEVFGADRVGLRTGDITINASADILVMTTEILRNISYRVLLEEEPAGLRQNLDNVGLTVLDEVHYLGNRERGSVWEEIIINCPAHVQMLAMSATVANAGELGAWISQVHGRCVNVDTTFRPVPLKWWFAWSEGDDGSCRLVELLKPASDHSVKMNPEIESFGRDYEDRVRRLELLMDSLQGRSFEQSMDTYREIEMLEQELDALRDFSRIPKQEVQFAALVNLMHERDMLPAIYFMFSRKRCNESAMKLGTRLVTAEERVEILRELNELRSTQPEAIPANLAEPLLNGVASHHAGHLPGWKATVEKLFQRGLIKVVFATETLAAGINMPARTTIISALSRRRDGGYKALGHNEVLQMAGRAGRRGYDSQGHCIITQSNWEGAREGVDVIAKGPEPIDSQFSVSYGMVLNLLSTRSLEECRSFLDRSFLRYQSTVGYAAAIAEAQRLESRAAALLDSIGSSEDDEARKQYEAAKVALKLERRTLRVVRSQAMEVREALAADALQLTHAPSSAPGSLRFAEDDDDSDSALTHHADSPQPSGAVAVAELKSPRAVRFPILVTLDLSKDGRIQEDLRSALCLGPVTDFDLDSDPDIVGYSMENLSLFTEPGVLVCLLGDNQLYLVRAKHIAAVHNDEASLNALLQRTKSSYRKLVDTMQQCMEDSMTQNWRRLHFGVLAAPSSSASARIALQVAMMEFPNAKMLLEDAGWAEAVEEALLRVKVRKSEYRTLKAKATKAITQTSAKAVRATTEEAARLKRAARQLRQSHTATRSVSWQDFINTVEVLKKFVAVQPTERSSGFTPLTDLGYTARDIRFENELWLAMVLDVHGYNRGLAGVQPSTLAGLICAIVTPFQVMKPDALTSMQPSEELKLLVEGTANVATELALAQAKYSVASPISIDLRFAGAVERWVWMASDWTEITAESTLDDGDIARLLSRVADLLKQIAGADSVDKALRKTARQAYKRVYRQPIRDLLGG